MFPFFIKRQQARLERYAANVAEKKVQKPDASVIGVKSSIEKANHAYSYYLLNTRNVFGRILSVIPGTAAFQTRIIAASKIDKAFEMLKQQERKLRDAAIRAPTAQTRKRSNSIHSATVVLPPVYPSPIRGSKSKENNSIKSQYTVNNIITIKPTRLFH